MYYYLLDAIQDFGKVPPAQQPSPKLKGDNDDMNQVWTEEFIKEATAQFEKKMRECMVAQQQGLPIYEFSFQQNLYNLFF